MASKFKNVSPYRQVGHTHLSCSAEVVPNFTVNKACRPTVLQWQKVYMPLKGSQMAAIAFLSAPVPWYVKTKQIETL